MSLFLTPEEKQALKTCAAAPRFVWSLRNRTARRAESPGLTPPDATVQWWYFAAEALTDAAAAHAIGPEAGRAAWLRDAALSVARRPEDDWIGPFFRARHTNPQRGHLEAAHLAEALGVGLRGRKRGRGASGPGARLGWLRRLR